MKAMQDEMRHDGVYATGSHTLPYVLLAEAALGALEGELAGRERTRVLEEALGKARELLGGDPQMKIRDWIHGTPMSECGPGADTCPDWKPAIELEQKLGILDALAVMKDALAAVAVEDDGYMPEEDEQAHAVDEGAASVDRARQAAGTLAAEPPINQEENNERSTK